MYMAGLYLNYKVNEVSKLSRQTVRELSSRFQVGLTFS